jgi:hypothetical protein
MPTNGAYDKPEQQPHFMERLLERVQAIPGVAAAADSVVYPVGGKPRSEITIPGRTHSERWDSMFEVCSAGYFQTLQMPLLSGRFFSKNEDESAQRVIVINQTCAKKYFGSDNPIGQSIRFNLFDQLPGAPHNLSFEIIGVAGDVRNAGLRRPPMPQAYLSSTTLPGVGLSLLVTTSLIPTSLLPAIRRQVWSVDPMVALRYK